MEIPKELLNLFKVANQLNKGGEITMENDILTKDDWQDLREEISDKRRQLEEDIEYRRMIIRNEHNCIEDIFTRKYKGPGYTVLARPNSCFFCKHLTDIFYDCNGPYLYLCKKHPQTILAGGETLIENEDYIQKGMLGKCEDFMEEKK